MKPLQISPSRLVAAVFLFLVFGSPLPTSAQTQAGRVEVRAIKGTATYSSNGGPAKPLKVGTVLFSGAIIKTDADSTVDLFLGNSTGVIRVTEKSTLSIDKLALTDTGADTAVDVQLNLPDGDMYFNVNKISKASRYEIKMPNGVAGIRGTKGGFSFRPTGGLKPPVILTDGKLVFVHAPAGGPMTSHLMTAPPAVYFSATEGVKIAPLELALAVDKELEDLERKSPFGGTRFPPPRNKPIEPFMSPGSGVRSRQSGGTGESPGK